jgi:hypothetical protein
MMLAAALLTSLLAASPVPPELLDKLAAHDQKARSIRNRLALVISSTAEEMDNDYQTTARHESVIRMVVIDGKETPQIIRATKDGVDVTEERRQKVKEREKSKEGKQSMQMESPFAASERAKYTFEALGTDATTSMVRIGFGPKEGPTTELWSGEALVDPQTGELVSLFGRPSKLPTLIDAMSMQLLYDARVEGTRMLSQITFAGEGGVLFVHKRMRGTTRFSYEPLGEKK